MTEEFENNRDRRIAFLVDGDNAQPGLVEPMLAEVGRYGTPTIRHIYGDWTTPNMNGWKQTLHVHAIQPMQQFRYTTGKNATDSALIIEAMDILHAGDVSGFCLVSSDSDYTRLATRIREEGVFVMGIGTKATPSAFVSACEVFVYTENLGVTSEAPAPGPVQEADSRESTAADAVRLLSTAFQMSVQSDGWASLGVLGNRLHQLDPGFDPRTYKYRQLSQMLRAFKEVFELRERKTKEGASLISVRLREQAPDSPAPAGRIRGRSRTTSRP